MEDGNMTTDFSQTNETFSEFFKKLYSSEFPDDSISMEDFLNCPMTTTEFWRSQSQGRRLLKLFSLWILENPLVLMAFLPNFFKSFSSLLSPQLSAVLSDSFKLGRLPSSLTEACITLVAKTRIQQIAPPTDPFLSLSSLHYYCYSFFLFSFSPPWLYVKTMPLYFHSSKEVITGSSCALI